MPDFTYHPFFKPLLFRVSAETARAITIRLLAIQGTTRVGRTLFRAFARAAPPKEAAVHAFGFRFPSAVGLAAGIDVDGIALPVMQHLGFGYLGVGPASVEAVEEREATNPLRIVERHAIVQSDRRGAPSIASIAARRRAHPEVCVPIALTLRYGGDSASAAEELVGDVRAVEDGVDILMLPADCATVPGLFARLRAATARPLVLRLAPEWGDAELDRVIDDAIEAGIEGVVAVAAATCPLLEGGSIEGPFLLERAIATTEHVARRAGDKLVVVGAGGVTTPDDARRLLDAGARLVEIGAGFVYAGPGLPKRITHAVLHRETPRPLAPSGPMKRRAPAFARASLSSMPSPSIDEDTRLAPLFSGWLFVLGTGVTLAMSGLFALYLAATVELLPNDVRYLGMTVADLCHHDACRIVHFMVHDRVSWGGSIISIGLVYMWLAAVPLRRGEPWAWWTAAISGFLGFASFLTYIGYGYLDRWHAAATLLLIPVFLLGLAGSFTTLRGDRSFWAIGRGRPRAFLWSPAGMGRACMTFSAFGMIAGGATIMGVGMTRVFVPTDLEFMGVTVADLNQLNPRLVSLIAHDRSGFGGGLLSGGVAIMLCLWCGARPRERGLWLALCLSGTVGFATAIGVHPIVGYTSFLHLLPAYLGAASFVVGIVLLRKPMLDVDRPSAHFPDV